MGRNQFTVYEYIYIQYVAETGGNISRDCFGIWRLHQRSTSLSILYKTGYRPICPLHYHSMVCIKKCPYFLVIKLLLRYEIIKIF